MDNRLKETIDQQLASPTLDPWREILTAWRQSAKGQYASEKIALRLSEGAVIYPERPFRALEKSTLDNIKVCIVGQDPYHQAGQAEGLCFSVAPGIAIPRSLRNIYKELERSLSMPMPTSGSLMKWAEQGVLLLNTALTVEDSQPNCHAKWGWSELTGEIIRHVAEQRTQVVFMLWGGHAQSLKHLIPSGHKHLILESNHPSPLSATKGATPFIGNNHFVKANVFLIDQGLKPIDWSV